MNLALLIIRVVVGLTLASHGSQKLFGWFGGGGIAGTSQFFGNIGFTRAHAWMAAITELGGGLALAVGILTPLAAAAVFGVMLTVIATTSWKKGFFNMAGGYEFPLMIGAVGLAMAFSGPGHWSVDHAIGWSLGGTEWGIAASVAGVVTSFVVVTTRGWGLRSADRSVRA